MTRIDKKIEKLRKLTKNFLFIQYYSHTKGDMYKIINEHSSYREDKWVLFPVSDGLEKSLDAAIDQFEKQLNTLAFPIFKTNL